MIHPRGDFPLEQSYDDTPHSAFDQVIEIDGHLVCPEAAQAYPHFVLLNNRLYQVSCDTHTEEEYTQLLVLKSRREIIFQAAHYNPLCKFVLRNALMFVCVCKWLFVLTPSF